MLRFGSLALIGLAAIACNKTEQGRNTPGSPDASAAGREAIAGSRDETTTAPSSASGLARSLVTVAATTPSDAQPCERTCGRVGDCLLETRTFDEFESGRLELECLDRCVHASEDAASRSAFLACDQQAGCGELLGCARTNWDTLAAARVAPLVTAVVASVDQCFLGCQWLYSCVYTNQPPGQAHLAPEHEEVVRYCETQMCPNMGEAERAQYVYFVECMPMHCSMESFQNCMLNSYY